MTLGQERLRDSPLHKTMEQYRLRDLYNHYIIQNEAKIQKVINTSFHEEGDKKNELRFDCEGSIKSKTETG